MSETPEFLNLPIVVSKEVPISVILVNIVETCQFSIICFTFPFYIFIIAFLLDAQTRRIDELGTPFFKLCISASVIDLLTLSNNYLGAMFPKWGWGIPVYLYLNKVYAHTYLYFAWSMGACQGFSVCVLATNRLSAILYPNEHRALWNRERIYIAYTIQFLPGLLMGFLTFLNDVQLFKNVHGGIVPKFMTDYLTKLYFAIAGLLILLVSIYLTCSYCYIFYFIRRFYRKKSCNSRMDVKNRELKLFAMSSTLVAIQLSVLGLLIVKTSRIVEISTEEFYLIYNALTDLNAGINPYLLWIFSDSLRTYILRRIGFRKPRNKSFASAVSMIVVQQQQQNQQSQLINNNNKLY